MTDVYLREHPNLTLPQYRSPRRERLSGIIVVHSAENTPDYVAYDGGAEAVAHYLSVRDTYGSYHTLADSDSILRCVRYDDEAFHDATSGGNRHEIGISVATRADVWPLAPKAWRDGAVENLAIAAADAARHIKATRGIDVPARLLTRAESEDRRPGFISHARRDPTRRGDPGAFFPWDDFFARFVVHMGNPANPTKDWFDMATEAEIRTIVAGEVNRAIGAIWTAEAAAVKRHQAIRVLFGSIRGWSAAAAEKLYGDDLGQARDRAVELDDSPKK